MRTPLLSRLALFIGTSALLVVAAPLDAQKTDVIAVVNGDEVTGEIKSVDRGILNYKTDDMGTLSVKWEKVLRITSRHFFEVELETGEKYYGNLPPSGEDGLMVVAVAEFSDTLSLHRVVRIYPIEATFWQRLRGYIDIGLTFQRANRNTQWSLGGQVSYRGQKWASRLDLSSYLQDTETQESATLRNSANLSAQRFLGHRWSALAGTIVEQNDEQELDRRTQLYTGGGLFAVQRIRGFIQVSGGISWTNELFAGNESPTNSAELFITGDAAYYHLDSPKTDLSGTVNVYPSITDLGRVRINIDARVSHELFSDFTLSLTFFDKYDSRPPSATASQNDFGFTFSLGYKFNM